ncbi:conserved Plasmodium protein, unknown function [Babesia microti strain RI]|uniref:Uncharacterized protein n=1 Tax=Babesia microti (strain RI) TaxID=1133968 RepID=A0A1N6LY03_BABMR|nr:conserved Plasmodium protein, unknown function [Babesia microti strain RI]SIO73742.1 conserved Plasmodium protein, unknown function [Babesia microti strain RI]|eukprot:XP_021337805.1 conserved Plasmodium protein, unknown function [Babesia microti strain RI]
MVTSNDLADGRGSWNSSSVIGGITTNDSDVTNWLAGLTPVTVNRCVEGFAQDEQNGKVDQFPPIIATFTSKNDIPSPFIPPNGKYKQGDLLLFSLNPDEIVQRLRKKVYQKVNIVMQELISDLESLGATKSQIMNRLYQTSWFSALFDYDSIGKLLNVFQIYANRSNALVMPVAYKTLFDSLQASEMKPIEEITSANIDLNSFLSELVTKRDLLVKRLYSHRLEIQELQDRVSQSKMKLEQKARMILIKCDELEAMHGRDDLHLNNILDKYKHPDCSLPLSDQFDKLESLIKSLNDYNH